jgi:hypothetical protein
MTNRIGDRPQFPLSNQRFDKGDANSISSYYEEIISRFTGSIYGQAWGCMSNPEFSIVPGSGGSGPYITIKRCVLLYSVPIDGTLNTTSQDKGPWAANTLLFDPAKDGQPLVMSLFTRPYFTAFPAPKRPWILFRRAETDTGTSNKAYWDTTTNTEQVGAAELQRTEYVEFKLSTSYSSTDRSAGWYRMAYIDSWGSPASEATPNIIPIHWMDSQYYADSTPPASGTAVASALALAEFPAAAGEKGFDATAEMPELAKLMHWMAGKLGQHYSTTSTIQITADNEATYNLKPGAFIGNYGDVAGGWLSTPPRGLLELDGDLNSLEDSIVPAIASAVAPVTTSLNAFITKYARTPRLLHTLYVQPTVNSWPSDVTFSVTYDSATVEPTGFSPVLIPYVGGSTPANQLAYRFTASAGGADDRTMNLELFSSSYMLTSVHVVHYISHIGSLFGNAGLSVNQRYNGILPPGSNAILTFVIEDPEGNDVVRPFTVFIYGRNI